MHGKRGRYADAHKQANSATPNIQSIKAEIDSTAITLFCQGPAGLWLEKIDLTALRLFGVFQQILLDQIFVEVQLIPPVVFAC